MVEQTKSKALVRKEKLALRNSIPLEEREFISNLILEKLIHCPLYKECDTILIYSSYQSEADTTDLIFDAFQKAKKVFCPKVHGDEMEFYRIFSLADLFEGYKKIKEPLPSAETLYPKEAVTGENVLVILPLAAFNGKCQRIGYGKGYYDKYLSALKGNFHTIGIAYDMQYEPDFEADTYDYPLDYIITEKQIYQNGGTHSWNI